MNDNGIQDSRDYIHRNDSIYTCIVHCTFVKCGKVSVKCLKSTMLTHTSCYFAEAVLGVMVAISDCFGSSNKI